MPRFYWLPELKWQSLTWNCDSLSLGMSFQVARKTCRSVEGHTKTVSGWKLILNRNILPKKLHSPLMPERQSKEHIATNGNSALFSSFRLNRSHRSEWKALKLFVWCIKQKPHHWSWWIVSENWRAFTGIVMKQSGGYIKRYRNNSPTCSWCVLCTSNCVAKWDEQALWGRRSLARAAASKFTQSS